MARSAGDPNAQAGRWSTLQNPEAHFGVRWRQKWLQAVTKSEWFSQSVAHELFVQAWLNGKS
jgi:hypothetical protein